MSTSSVDESAFPDARIPLKQGYVRKLPPLHKAKKVHENAFRKRFLVLWTDSFAYYTDSSRRTRKKGIKLTDCQQIDSSFRHTLIGETDHAFAVITAKRTFLFFVDNELEKASWCQQLERAIKHAKDPVYAEIGGISDIPPALRKTRSLTSLAVSEFSSVTAVIRQKHHAVKSAGEGRGSLTDLPSQRQSLDEKYANRDRNAASRRTVASGIRGDRDSGLSVESTVPRRHTSLLLDPVARRSDLIKPISGGSIAAGNANTTLWLTPNAVKAPRLCSVSVYVDSGLMPVVDENERVLSPVVYIDTNDRPLEGPGFLYLPHCGSVGDGWTLKAMTCGIDERHIPLDWNCHGQQSASQGQAMISVIDRGWYCLVGQEAIAKNQPSLRRRQVVGAAKLNVRVVVFGRRVIPTGTRWSVVVVALADSDDLFVKVKRQYVAMQMLGDAKGIPVGKSSAVAVNVVDPNGVWESTGSIKLRGSTPSKPLWEALESFDSKQVFKFTLQMREEVEAESFSVGCEIRIVDLESEKSENELFSCRHEVTDRTLWNVIEIDRPLAEGSPKRNKRLSWIV